MGSYFGALGSIGEAQAGAEELRRKRALEQARIDIDKGYLGVQQAEFDERKKQAAQPQFKKFSRGMDGKFHALSIDPSNGRVVDEILPFNEATPADDKLRVFRQVFGREPQTDQERMMVMGAMGAVTPTATPHVVMDPNSSTGWSEIYTDKFGNELGRQAGAAPPASTVGSAKTSTTTNDPFSGASSTKSTTTKIPSFPVGGGAVKTAAPAPHPALQATPPHKAAQSRARLQWNDVAPSPAFYSGEGKPLVPEKYWSRVDEMAKALRDGAVKVPAIGSKNFQLWTAIMARSRELGWSGGPPATTAERDAAEWARRALPHISEVRELIASLDKQGQLGPLAGRYNEFMTGKVGTGPEFERLRANLGLLTTALMRQHVGARGGVRLLDHFEGLWNAGRMDAATLNAGIDVMESFMRSYSSLDRPTLPGQPDATAQPSPTAQSPAWQQALDSIFPKANP